MKTILQSWLSGKVLFFSAKFPPDSNRCLVTIRNQPSCSNSSRFRTLQAKKAMFNLNENNRIVMSQHPSDMRIGV
ncbi:MAG: hypothetical protein PUF38_02610, partial [Bacteroidales bacterium]|nr:hypothetical protein [Bacteroidales bacterium]